ncbi:MAG TPA: 4-alpha-glucanotransferase [Candidatus Baltobacteraceae bacterium]|jgi:4-alpha-glucanotransferase|nr:4-alpha-glucanotransferase [Candidatus Baltobacteraceae bacterium]
MLSELAREAGIADSYTDYFGREKIVSRETKRAILAAMGLSAGSERQAMRLARDLRAAKARAARSAPKASAAFIPPRADNVWGYSLQLYSLRSSRNWGIGDFGDLARFVQTARECGADLVGINPLHQLYLTNPTSASPYSPLSRLQLNALYIDVDTAWRKLLGREAPVSSAALQAVRDTEFVDYAAVADLKVPALRALYGEWNASQHGGSAEFERFRTAAGTTLRETAIYEALNAYFKERNADAYGWMQWPAEFANPNSSAVARFAGGHAHEVRFYEFLQWVADEQLAAASHAAQGMAIGLYRDLAVGVDANGADVWRDRAAYSLALSVGAPPDALNTQGQNWGLPPLNPHVLRERRYAPFVSVLRANMRHAGALRIDHVMGLQRLYLIPHGAPASDGAYVQYPLEALVGLLAAESRANHCLIVGEDLGTVPPGFRERMAQARVLSCRLLYFEDPRGFPQDAVASTGTHDLPPLLGEWPSLPPAKQQTLCEWAQTPAPADGGDCAFVTSTYRALAHSPARVVLVQMEDALLQREAVNVPGTTTEQPNWRRKLPVAVEALQGDVCFATLAGAVSEARPRKEER